MAIRGILKKGFHVYREQKVRWRFFRCTATERPLEGKEVERLESAWNGPRASSTSPGNYGTKKAATEVAADRGNR
jgi:hypothetical protein